MTPASGTPRAPLVTWSVTPQALPPPDPSSAEKDTVVLVNTALVARIEALEAENRSLGKNIALSQSKGPFWVEQIKNDNQLIRFYTGFTSYMIFLTFFEFFGPVVNDLNYANVTVSESWTQWTSCSYTGEVEAQPEGRRLSLSFPNFCKCSLPLHHYMDMLSLPPPKGDWVGTTVEQMEFLTHLESCTPTHTPS